MKNISIAKITHAGELFRAVNGSANGGLGMTRIEDCSGQCLAVTAWSPEYSQTLIDGVAGPFVSTFDAAAQVANKFKYRVLKYCGVDLIHYEQS